MCWWKPRAPWKISAREPCGGSAGTLSCKKLPLPFLKGADENRIQLEVENDLRDQIAHNIRKGVLKSTASGEVKYSWRGMIYLWCQFLLDLVRL